MKLKETTISFLISSLYTLEAGLFAFFNLLISHLEITTIIKMVEVSFVRTTRKLEILLKLLL